MNQNTKHYKARYRSRAFQGNKIANLLCNYIKPSQLKASTALDIGCSSGEITRHLSQYFRLIVGGDIQVNLPARFDKNNPDVNMRFLGFDAEHLPFQASSFDVVVCAQVYEHTENAEQLIAQIFRVLRPGGICYLSGPNKWTLIEDHYKLPFLSWLPQKTANRYLKLTRKIAVYDIRPKSYGKLKYLVKDFSITDCLPSMLANPDIYFSNRVIKGFLKTMKKFSGIIALFAGPFVPNYNWILIKPSTNSKSQ